MKEQKIQPGQDRNGILTGIQNILNKEADAPFWRRFLGEELYSRLLTDPARHFILPDDKHAAVIGKLQNAFLEENRFIEGEEYRFPENRFFTPLYQQVIAVFLQRNPLKGSLAAFLDNGRVTVQGILYSGIQDIGLRVCIYDMQLRKAEGKLRGSNTEEEYQDYCRRLLRDPEYLKALCTEYPELLRLLFARLLFAFRNLVEFLGRLEDDRQLLETRLLRSGKINRIQKADTHCSDSHREGRGVIICTLDNGEKLVYKPHSLKKEAAYRKLYDWFCDNAGLDRPDYVILKRDGYGWETFLSNTPCDRAEEVTEYFVRMGIHLFLCMLLNATDMHQENILAAGRHPVILDLETAPGVRKRKEPEDAQEFIHTMIADSVLSTAILPVSAWNSGEGGVALSALYRDEEKISPFRVPVIRNAGTSEMRLDYQTVKLNRGRSLPVFEGAAADPGMYTEELCGGFTQAYRLFCRKRTEAETLLAPFWDSETRFLVRHTQQYNMYLSSSLHPMFLKDTSARLLMLQILQKGDVERQFVGQEIGEMFSLDIPYFTCNAGEYQPFFEGSAFECCKKRASLLCEEDLDAQISLIRLSMEMAGPENRQNRYFDPVMRPARRSQTSPGKAAEKLCRIIEKRAVKVNGDIGFRTLRLENNQSWKPEPAGTELYNGISGIAIFLAQMKTLGILKDTDLYEGLIQKLFRYTDSGEWEKEKQTGLLTGPASVSCAFLYLYRITGDERFLSYAKKQAAFLEKAYPDDASCDLLSGNAGAVVLLTELYEETGDSSMLGLAAEIGDFLWKKAVKQETGYGWLCSNENRPLSGMAHGCSGFLTAYASLLKHTGEERFQRIIEETLACENSLYSAEKGNWRDLRYPHTEAYANAWCHGAAGILLSRMKLMELAEFRNSAEVMDDIENAASVLFTQSFRKGLCFCHGMAGNLWIMGQYRKNCELTGVHERRYEQLKQAVADTVAEWNFLLPQDRQSQGLMTGLAGIGCVLGQIYREEGNRRRNFRDN